MDWMYWAVIGIICANILFFGAPYVKYIIHRGRDREHEQR